MDAISYKGGAGRIFGPVSLSVRAGEIVGLLGPNGAGKTSLLKTIAGDCKAQKGQIHVHEIEITRLTRAARQAAGVFVCLHDHHRVRANRSLLEVVAAAVKGEPRFLLLDEPFNGLPGVLSRHVMLATLKACRDAGCGILLADHDMRAALQIVDRAYVIYRGEILAEGNPEELQGQQGD